MELKSEIKKIDFGSNAELEEIQNLAVEFAKSSTEFLLESYNDHPDTMGGRYICSDTFKELFPCFEVKENRALVNDAIHNSSAVLAATQFEEVLKRDEPGKTKAIFITGIPGAGKTTSVKNFMTDDKVKLIFEGQLANPAPTIPKIEQCLQKKLDVTIAAVHIEPEKALDNTFKRFNEYGRGGSIEVMSSIQGNLPSGLKKLKEHFGDKINIIAIDRNSDKNKILTDEKEIYKLISIGSKEEIFKRLKVKLDQNFQKGRIDKACFAQANETKLNKIMPNRIDPTEIAKFKSELEQNARKVLNSSKKDRDRSGGITLS